MASSATLTMVTSSWVTKKPKLAAAVIHGRRTGEVVVLSLPEGATPLARFVPEGE